MPRRPSRPASRASRSGGPWWSDLPREELLERRVRDLGLALGGTALEGRVRRLHAELGRAGLRFRPYAWLSSDWFTPDGVTGFAVPFFLAHPRLARLERAMMLEVEGGTAEWCMRLLRHETAHALDNAYRLRRRKLWRETFGHASTPYRADYVPDPTSRDHVENLDHWYAQSHPLEDWAETFAVWLAPGSRWRARYAGWPALAKLEVVDRLMAEIARVPPPVRTRERVEPVRELSVTLREHYRRKQATYEVHGSSAWDRPLRRLFAAPPATARPRGGGDSADAGGARRPARARSARAGGRDSAASFLRRSRRELVRRVTAVTGQRAYLVDQVLTEMIPRARALDLRLDRPAAEALVDTAIQLTALTMRFQYGAHPRYQR